jgi:cytoskeleton protein RodZ
MASLGEELRKQREIRQISLREISDATKISIRFLEGIERNDFSHLPGGQFTKGFIRAYARHVGIDSEKMIEAYDEELHRQDEEARTARDGEPREGLGWKTSYTVVLAAVGSLILLVALAVWVVTVLRSPAKSQSRDAAAGSSQAAGSHSPAPATDQAPPPEAPFSMQLSCLSPVTARVTCDGQLAYEGELQAGDLRSAKCQGELKVTMGDQLALTVNRGSPAAAPSNTAEQPPAAGGEPR